MPPGAAARNCGGVSAIFDAVFFAGPALDDFGDR